MMNRIMLLAIFIVVAVVSILWWRLPICYGKWSKQTLYVGMMDIWYGGSKDSHAHAMWIDDDGTEGVFIVKTISDELDIHANFAVIADRIKPDVADSLTSWQRQGAGIVLHGLRHERWKNWGETKIKEDILKSYQKLNELGFDTTRILKLILPPHGCNTKAIRQVIKQQGCQMISGANLINPDRHVFQLGRIAITSQTDTTTMHKLLQNAYDRKAFVIFGTHSSISSSFSAEKTIQVLKMAKEIGFIFDIYE